jgi:hypothetical protein
MKKNKEREVAARTTDREVSGREHSWLNSVTAILRQTITRSWLEKSWGVVAALPNCLLGELSTDASMPGILGSCRATIASDGEQQQNGYPQT